MGISNVASNLRPGICTSTTRPSAPYEGQVIYETDTNLVRVYDGSSWKDIGPLDVSASFTAKGDILTRNSSAITKLSVGTNNFVLMADSGETTGLKWHGGYVDFTPTLTASTTNPNIGSTGVLGGRYLRLGNFVHYFFNIGFGGTGVSAGSGTYRISLPINSATGGTGAPTNGQTGSVEFYRGATLSFNVGNSTARGTYLELTHQSAGISGTTNSSPWTWASGDIIRGSILYQAA